MFDFNNIIVQEETFCGSQVYTMDNVFVDVEAVIRFLDTDPPLLWKANEKPSFNNTYFIDRRHVLHHEVLFDLQQELSMLCRQQPATENAGHTNFTKFLSKDFNNYQECFWWPHRDPGYTGIIYLNEYEGPGTNLYEIVDKDPSGAKEHEAPWRPREKFKVIKTLIAKQNRLVFFDAKKFLHGMAIETDLFFTEERKNLTMFFRG